MVELLVLSIVGWIGCLVCGVAIARRNWAAALIGGTLVAVAFLIPVSMLLGANPPGTARAIFIGVLQNAGGIGAGYVLQQFVWWLDRITAKPDDPLQE